MVVPVLRTDRLFLRPFGPDDAPAVTALAGDRQVAATTLLIPHPYSIDDAREWIASQPMRAESDQGFDCAVTLRIVDDGHPIGTLVGAIGVSLQSAHQRGEIGYWIGVPFWGNGYCTEAARAVVDFCFRTLGLVRITSHYFAGNEASGAVMRKIGLSHEGTLRQHVLKWGRFTDAETYGMLRSDWESARNAAPGLKLAGGPG